MEDLDTARRYHCARCHQPVIICRDCDRGNIYCFDGCAQAAEKERCKRNAKRYRDSAKGKRTTLARQRRHRLRQALLGSDPESCKQHPDTPEPATAQSDTTSADLAIVTHRGSVDVPRNAPLNLLPQTRPIIYCNGCQRICSEAVRINFMRTNRRRSSYRQYTGTPP